MLKSDFSNEEIQPNWKAGKVNTDVIAETNSDINRFNDMISDTIKLKNIKTEKNRKLNFILKRKKGARYNKMREKWHDFRKPMSKNLSYKNKVRYSTWISLRFINHLSIVLLNSVLFSQPMEHPLTN